MAAIATDLISGLAMHTDETPMKSAQCEEPIKGAATGKIETVEKTGELVYIRTHSNASSTLSTENKHKRVSSETTS